ncbi:MAG: hypothetical protein PHN52_11440 [candidate division Zixibacteria bacterium]|nr:hypothetical protein [candidate division Zixibacteria bacterium]
MKSKYQRNYLIAIITANGFIGLIVMLYIVLYDNSANKSQLQILFNDKTISESIIVFDQSKMTGKGTNVLKDFKDSIPDGYIGTYKISKYYQTIKPIISDNYMIDLHEPTLKPYTANSFDNGQESEEGAFYGFGGGDDNYGFADEEPYMPKLHFNSIDRFNNSINDLSNQTAIVLIPSPMWPPRARYLDTGMVEVDLIIDTKGHISWNIISESPSGKGFSIELIEALKRGRYSPTVKNGQKTEIYLRLSCMFCYGCEPSLKSSSNNVLAGILK